MTAFVIEPAQKPLLGYAEVPGDKSISHRSLLFGALCRDPVRIRGLGAGGDNRGTARALRAMGVEIRTEAADPAAFGTLTSAGKGVGKGVAAAEPETIIDGVGLRGLKAPAGPIDCGNSGTTMRLLCGLLAPQPFAVTLIGDESLTGRPMRRVTDPLSEMGAMITGASGAKPDNVYPPLAIAAMAAGAGIKPLDYRLPIASAQVKSAVLLAGLYADGVTRVIEPGPTRDHTERMLAHMGAPITVHAGNAVGEGIIELDTRGWDGVLTSGPLEVPADPSQAAFILAAALMAGVERITVPRVCLNPTRIGFLDVLADMNVLVERESMQQGGAEPIADLSVSRGVADHLSATEIGGQLSVRSIDELPILAVIAARAAGTTHIRDAAELRVKESDRIAATCNLLRALGCSVEERPDGFSIEGMPDRAFTPARIHAGGDHRIAMAGAVAGLAASGPVRIDGAECTATSFPSFIDVMNSLGATMRVVDE